MRKPLLILTALLFFYAYLSAQNSMVGDGFGGRGWYKPHNYQVGAYSAYTVCGDSNQLYAWGSNLKGELGNGSYTSSFTPVAVTGMTNVKFYSTGYLSAVIKTDSSAWVWGADYPAAFTNIPQQVLDNVKFVDGGANHIVFVKNDGTAWGAGSNQMGQLGNGVASSAAVTTPVQMTGITNAVRAVAAGGYTVGGGISATLILLADGTLKITGGGGWFQQVNSTIPVTLAGLSNVPVIDIKGNALAAYALTSAGELYSFGRDFTDGSVPALGIGNTTGNITAPAKVVFPVGAASIVALSANNDGLFALALDSNHNVYGWGGNFYGQLGDGTFVHKSTPVLLATNAVDIFAGENFSYILKSDGTLWATGQTGYDNIQWGSIWMNLPNIQRNVFTQIDPTIAPMNLCAPKVWGVVPIKLSSFTCVANGNNAVLNWQSAEETNASKYMVEYSSDGTSFKSIATIFAKGSNSQYNYNHFNVSGTAFYRLKMMDKDGSFSYSEIRVVKFNGKAGITIAPNPANDVIHLYTKNSNKIKSVQVFSVEGKLLQSINGYQTGQGVTISNLSRGIYNVKVIFKNEMVEYGRFIKM